MCSLVISRFSERSYICILILIRKRRLNKKKIRQKIRVYLLLALLLQKQARLLFLFGTFLCYAFMKLYESFSYESYFWNWILGWEIRQTLFFKSVALLNKIIIRTLPDLQQVPKSIRLFLCEKQAFLYTI